jgi:hypothetical protein
LKFSEVIPEFEGCRKSIEKVKKLTGCVTTRALLLRVGALTLAALIGLMPVVYPSTATSQGQKLDQALSDRVDAVLLLDASGSMRRTDPLKLRNEGAKLFTGFLKPGDRLAIVSFGDATEVIRPLSDYDGSQGNAVAESIVRVGDDKQFTDIYAGIRAAGDLLAGAKREGAQPVIVMLSDGKMDPDPVSGSDSLLTDKLLNEYLPQIKAQGLKVHTLALSELADQNLLRQIAVATDGVNFVAPTAETVHKSFADLFLVVKKPQVLPLTSKGLKVDADIQEATFYINREEGSEVKLVKPDGAELSAKSLDPAVKWFEGQKFDVITVEKPEPGDWVVVGVNPGDGFATVLTNLKLVSDWPSGIYDGQKPVLQARLYDGAKPIVLPQMTGQIRYGVRITPTDKVAEPVVKEFLVDDGNRGDQIANDGVFSLEIEGLEPGEYRLQVVARAPTFERSQQLPFRVRPRMVSLKVIKRDGAAHAAAPSGSATSDGHGSKPAESHAEGHGDEHKDVSHSAPDPHAEGAAAAGGHSGADEDFVVELSDEALQFRNIEVKLIAVGSDRTRYQLATEEHKGTSSTSYVTPVTSLPKSGTYEVQATMTAVGRRGAPVREMSGTLRYEYARDETLAVKVIVEQEGQEKPTEKEPSPVPYLLVITLLNLGFAGGAFVLIKKIAKSSAAKLPVFAPMNEALACINELEAAAAQTELSLSSPLFTDQSMTFTLRDDANGGAPGLAPVGAPPPTEPSAQAAEAPSEEA